jgi:5'-nucleotidase (lipoprotein e(P4) family)
MSISPRVFVLPIVVVLAGCGPRTPPAVAPAPSTSTRVMRDTHEDLHAVLWMQTAAEYRALTSAIYGHAGDVLEGALQDRSWTAALEQAGGYGALPPAVILDLDETVFDNSAFQGQLVRDRGFYTEDAWREWVHARRAGAVPGAQEFIRRAERHDVAVFFVSNRAAADEEDTIANLQALGIQTTRDELLSPGENGWTSDKAARREAVARTHRVLMLVGDDLGDFVPVARLSVSDRAALADRYTARWLERWVLLPNPSYGSWSRALTPGVTGAAQVLQEKMAVVRGFK